MRMVQVSEKSPRSLMTLVRVFAGRTHSASCGLSGKPRYSESMSMSLRLYVAVPSSLFTETSSVSEWLCFMSSCPLAPLSTIASDLKLSPRDIFSVHLYVLNVFVRRTMQHRDTCAASIICMLTPLVVKSMFPSEHMSLTASIIFAKTSPCSKVHSSICL